MPDPWNLIAARLLPAAVDAPTPEDAVVQLGMSAGLTGASLAQALPSLLAAYGLVPGPEADRWRACMDRYEEVRRTVTELVDGEPPRTALAYWLLFGSSDRG